MFGSEVFDLKLIEPDVFEEFFRLCEGFSGLFHRRRKSLFAVSNA